MVITVWSMELWISSAMSDIRLCNVKFYLLSWNMRKQKFNSKIFKYIFRNECEELRSFLVRLETAANLAHTGLSANWPITQKNHESDCHCCQIEVETFRDDVREKWVHFCKNNITLSAVKYLLLLNRMESLIEGLLSHSTIKTGNIWDKVAEKDIPGEVQMV